MTQIAVSAFLTVKPGFESDAEQVLLEVLKHSREEEGCLQYNLHTSLDDPKQFMLYELWKSQADIDQHGQTPHYLAYRKNIEPLIESRKVLKWEPKSL